jgi:hypothetical protein
LNTIARWGSLFKPASSDVIHRICRSLYCRSVSVTAMCVKFYPKHGSLDKIANLYSRQFFMAKYMPIIWVSSAIRGKFYAQGSNTVALSRIADSFSRIADNSHKAAFGINEAGIALAARLMTVPMSLDVYLTDKTNTSDECKKQRAEQDKK